MPHLPKSDGKAVEHAFLSQATFLEGLPNLHSKQPQSFQKRARLKKRSLEPAVRADVKALLDEACANKLHPAERAHPTVATK
ncbi:hypothetical protein WGM54_00060 [Paenibacillus polymyxa]|uniref:hypothetical protein n=1 Tax=Paenibacillus polymyxa TaxID=1406 RepID=UPI00307D38C5